MRRRSATESLIEAPPSLSWVRRARRHNRAHLLEILSDNKPWELAEGMEWLPDETQPRQQEPDLVMQQSWEIPTQLEDVTPAELRDMYEKRKRKLEHLYRHTWIDLGGGLSMYVWALTRGQLESMLCKWIHWKAYSDTHSSDPHSPRVDLLTLMQTDIASVVQHGTDALSYPFSWQRTRAAMDWQKVREGAGRSLADTSDDLSAYEETDEPAELTKRRVMKRLRGDRTELRLFEKLLYSAAYKKVDEHLTSLFGTEINEAPPEPAASASTAHDTPSPSAASSPPPSPPPSPSRPRNRHTSKGSSGILSRARQWVSHTAPNEVLFAVEPRGVRAAAVRRLAELEGWCAVETASRRWSRVSGYDMLSYTDVGSAMMWAAME
ncbi:unnamed protein product [Vitrella brassicaformis CCMP3155]|uniref:Uncharacterized protein n=2 Tax=Vitrella brassicaformis TaxID=1169539 RepID=A0A0G4GIQ9_VITBC|nr:unnamed protein product [Vitrella brassicaformis CCMP3155]|eukprot:CEM29584.1 unnamed protein product [Vitrella brassicaformis CCMP3155]